MGFLFTCVFLTRILYFSYSKFICTLVTFIKIDVDIDIRIFFVEFQLEYRGIDLEGWCSHVL